MGAVFCILIIRIKITFETDVSSSACFGAAAYNVAVAVRQGCRRRRNKRSDIGAICEVIEILTMRQVIETAMLYDECIAQTEG
jgi:hypothetical protein